MSIGCQLDVNWMSIGCQLHVNFMTPVSSQAAYACSKCVHDIGQRCVFIVSVVLSHAHPHRFSLYPCLACPLSLSLLLLFFCSYVSECIPSAFGLNGVAHIDLHAPFNAVVLLRSRRVASAVLPPWPRRARVKLPLGRVARPVLNGTRR